MIGYLEGEILFSDGHEVILKPDGSGIGYQVFSAKVYPEGSTQKIFVSHIVRENSEDLYSFDSFKDKKLFELLLSVSGVGPKSAYALVGSVGATAVIHAISFDDQKTLTTAPGIGKKAASKIILDLSGKIEKISMYGKTSGVTLNQAKATSPESEQPALFEDLADGPSNEEQLIILNEAIAACTELGFKEDKIKPVAKKIMSEVVIQKPEQLVHLVLKGV